MTETADPIARLLGDEHEAVTLRRVIARRWKQDFLRTREARYWADAIRERISEIEILNRGDLVLMLDGRPDFFDRLVEDLCLPRHQAMRQILVQAIAHHNDCR